jgi:hypothetical protein
MANTPNYDIDYKDERFTKVEDAKSDAMDRVTQTYGDMIANSDQYFKDQIQASKDWADEQTNIQNKQTDFAIQQIEQQKDQANKDYQKEQSGAYVDWRKQSNQYGTEAEKMASAGLANTGFSESSQVSMYNTYQNRVATAREVYNRAVLNYDNAIKDAQLQNSAALAEIAYKSLQQQLELSLQGFQYKNQLIIEQANKQTELDNIYYNRYQDVLQQINTENALAEDIRQFNENQKWQTEQAELDRQFKTKEAELDRQFEAAQAELNRKHDKEMLAAETKAEKEKIAIQHQNALKELEKKLANDKALLKYESELNRVNIGGGGGGGSASYPSYDYNKDGAVNGKDNNYIKKTGAVSTAYYQGAKNSDAAKYGTFANGYQPKGISGHGKLTKTGKTEEVHTSIQYGDNKGQKVVVNQNVWKAEDGTKWLWDGINNKYVRYK